jgi:hypothetical protein
VKIVGPVLHTLTNQLLEGLSLLRLIYLGVAPLTPPLLSFLCVFRGVSAICDRKLGLVLFECEAK